MAILKCSDCDANIKWEEIISRRSLREYKIDQFGNKYVLLHCGCRQQQEDIL